MWSRRQTLMLKRTRFHKRFEGRHKYSPRFHSSCWRQWSWSTTWRSLYIRYNSTATQRQQPCLLEFMLYCWSFNSATNSSIIEMIYIQLIFGRRLNVCEAPIGRKPCPRARWWWEAAGSSLGELVGCRYHPSQTPSPTPEAVPPIHSDQISLLVECGYVRRVGVRMYHAPGCLFV